MKKFKFQLETLLKVTRRKKDDAEMAFAEVSRRLEGHRARLQELFDDTPSETFFGTKLSLQKF